MNLSQLGTVLPDGSVLIDNTNVAYREAMTGDFKRVSQTAKQNVELGRWGYQPTLSSFISGVGVFNNDLRIRFHNGSVYEYYGFADKFDSMMKALSKGQYFNRHIRPTKLYKKIDSLDFSGGNMSAITDTEVFSGIEMQDVARTVMMLQGEKMKIEEVKIAGLPYQKIMVGELIYFRPISQ